MRELVEIGAYVPGADADADVALARMPQIEAFLRQDMDDLDLSRRRPGGRLHELVARMSSHRSTSGLHAVARVRGVRERDSRIGLPDRPRGAARARGAKVRRHARAARRRPATFESRQRPRLPGRPAALDPAECGSDQRQHSAALGRAHRDRRALATTGDRTRPGSPPSSCSSSAVPPAVEAEAEPPRGPRARRHRHAAVAARRHSDALREVRA